MIDADLLALHNAAVKALPVEQRTMEAAFHQSTNDLFVAIRTASDRLINALESGNREAIAECLNSIALRSNASFGPLCRAVESWLMTVVAPVAIHRAVPEGKLLDVPIFFDPANPTVEGLIKGLGERAMVMANPLVIEAIAQPDRAVPLPLPPPSAPTPAEPNRQPKKSVGPTIRGKR